MLFTAVELINRNTVSVEILIHGYEAEYLKLIMKYICCIVKLNFIKNLIITLRRRNNANVTHLTGVRDDARILHAI